MTHVYERVFVKTPYHLARLYLHEALANASTSHALTTLTLSLPVREGGLGIQREVTATYASGADPMHLDEPWKVHWTPKEGGPYPDFDGELTVRADEEYDTCVLELRGNYRPPGGLAGKAFDAMVGSRIASATAHELLNSIAREVQQRYERQEAAKRSSATD